MYFVDDTGPPQTVAPATSAGSGLVWADSGEAAQLVLDRRIAVPRRLSHEKVELLVRSCLCWRPGVSERQLLNGARKLLAALVAAGLAK